MKISKKQRSPFMMVLPFSGNQFCKCSSESPLRSEKNEANILSADQSRPSCVLPCAL